MPVTPHLSSECLSKFNYKGSFDWPKINKELLIKDNLEIVIQVNGKKRNTVLVDKDISESELIQQIKNKKLIDKYLNNSQLVKTIFVKQRLINYIIK